MGKKKRNKQKLNCPQCNKAWRISNNNIVEADCDCYWKMEGEYLYRKFMKDTGRKTAAGMLCKRLETPHGELVCASLHPFGITVSPDGFTNLIGFPWALTKDWRVIL